MSRRSPISPDAASSTPLWRGRLRHLTHHRLVRLVALTLALALLVTVLGWVPLGREPERGQPPHERPYAVAESGGSVKKVLAHYFPPYPISLDNDDPRKDYYTRNYLDPDGEGGQYRAVGGLLRDRPLPRDPLEEDYQLADARTEIDQATAAGIDGFTIDILDWSGALWDRTLRMGVAATESGKDFVVVPNLDLASNADDAEPSYISDRLAEFFSSPAAYRLADGRYVLSSFKAEARSVQWWTTVTRDLAQRHGIHVALLTVLLDASQQNLEEYAPISYALSVWGLRTPKSIENAPDQAGIAHRLGVKWMAPVAVQDVRHHFLRYAEAENTGTLRASWSRAISDDADLVQLVTWNDYSESTQFAPSRAHGWSFLDINGYYLTQFKSGEPPALTGDELVVTHRIQSYAAAPTVQRGSMDPTLSGTSVEPRDTVEVLALLRAPATITVRVGDTETALAVAAGVSTLLVPLQEGVVSASAARSGRVVAAVTSPHHVVASLPYYDLQYYAASSRKE